MARASCAMVRVRSRARRTNDRANLDAPLRQVQPHAVSFRVGVGSSARIRPLRGSTTSSTGHLVGGHLVGGHLVGGHLVGGPSGAAVSTAARRAASRGTTSRARSCTPRSTQRNARRGWTPASEKACKC